MTKNTVELFNSRGDFERLHELAEDARKFVKVPKEVLLHLLIDNLRLLDFLERQGVKVIQTKKNTKSVAISQGSSET